MDKDIFTATQKFYLKAQSLDELKKVFGNQIIALTNANLKKLAVYDALGDKGFLASLFNKSDKENEICTQLTIRSIAILLNSFRTILHDGLTKHTTDSLYKEIVSYVSGKLPSESKINIKDRKEFARDLYREISHHTEPKTAETVKNDMKYLSEVYPGKFTQSEMIRLQKFVTDGWVPLYPHTFITQYKKLYNRKD